MHHMRTLLVGLNLSSLVLSFVTVASLKGTYEGGICALAFLPSCVIAFGWVAHDDLMNPLAGVWLSVFLGMSLRADYIALSSSDRVDVLMSRLQFSDLAVGALIATLGCGFIVLGFVAFRSVRFTTPSTGIVLRLRQDRLMWLSILAGGIAALAAVDFLRRTGFDLSGAISAKRRVATDSATAQGFESLGYHRWLASTVPAIFFYIWFWNAQQRKDLLSRVMAASFFVFVALFAFVCSSRMTICILLLNAIYIMHASGTLRFFSVVVVGIAVAIVITVMLAFRQAAREESQTAASDILGLTTVVDAVLGNENFADLARLTRIYQHTPELMPYKYGISYITWIVAPIPRSLWPEKPVLSQGLEIAELIYGARRLPTGIEGGGRPPGFLGEVLMNFGVYGIPAMAFFYGGLMRVFQNFQEANRRVHVLLSVGIIMPISFELMGSEFSRVVIIVTQSVIPSLIVLLLAANKGRLLTVAENVDEEDESLLFEGV
jgi:oligosaccharide repeat unit polymerase